MTADFSSLASPILANFVILEPVWLQAQPQLPGFLMLMSQGTLIFSQIDSDPGPQMFWQMLLTLIRAPHPAELLSWDFMGSPTSVNPRLTAAWHMCTIETIDVHLLLYVLFHW